MIKKMLPFYVLISLLLFNTGCGEKKDDRSLFSGYIWICSNICAIFLVLFNY